jgi:hypothetical protein
MNTYPQQTTVLGKELVERESEVVTWKYVMCAFKDGVLHYATGLRTSYIVCVCVCGGGRGEGGGVGGGGLGLHAL